MSVRNRAALAALLLLAAGWLLWRGRAGEPGAGSRLLFLSYDGQDRLQLFVAEPDGENRAQWTEAVEGVVDFALAPAGDRLVYGGRAAGGGVDLWLLETAGGNGELLLACAPDYCGGAVWAPDGRRLLYERRTASGGGEAPGPPRLWWLDVLTGESAPLYEDEQVAGMAARFSAGGDWLAYLVPLREEMQMIQLETGEGIALPNRSGEPPAWQPEPVARPALVVADIIPQGERFSVYLYRVETPAGERTNLSGDVVTNDANPAWSPDGEWLAFGRKPPRAPVGRQIWLMRPDGSEQQSLTAEPESNFGQLSWSADGRWLVTQRFRLAETGAEPEIWLVDVETGAMQQVAAPGMQPRWLE